MQGGIFASPRRKTSEKSRGLSRQVFFYLTIVRNASHRARSPTQSPRFDEARRLRGRQMAGGPPSRMGRPYLHASISRVLSRSAIAERRRPFLWADGCPSAQARDPFPNPRTAGTWHCCRVGTACTCTRWGLPCPGGHPTGGALLPHRFTLTADRGRSLVGGGLFSVALSLTLQRAGGRYPPPCPTVLGLSSRREIPTSGRPDALG